MACFCVIYKLRVISTYWGLYEKKKNNMRQLLYMACKPLKYLQYGLLQKTLPLSGLFSKFFYSILPVFILQLNDCIFS